MKYKPLMDHANVIKTQRDVHGVFDNTETEVLQNVIRACCDIERAPLRGNVQIDMYTAKMMATCPMMELSRWVDAQMSEANKTDEEVSE